MPDNMYILYIVELKKILRKKKRKANKMKTYKVTYNGNSSRFSNFEMLTNANSEREAVEDVYAERFDTNYFPQPDGSIDDCDGHTIADANDDTIEFDGGYFSAEEN